MIRLVCVCLVARFVLHPDNTNDFESPPDHCRLEVATLDLLYAAVRISCDVAYQRSVQRNPQAAANALTAKVGAAANKEDAEQPADTDQQHQSKRQKQQLPSEDAQQHGDGGSGVGGGSGGDQTSKKKRFIPEPARKNGPNSKRRKKSNATPFHAAYAQITRPNCAKHGTPEQLVLHNRFNKMLRHYVRMVAAPLLGVGPDDVIYQRNPTLRISQPSDIAM